MDVVKIIVEGGCVLDVVGLPPGCTWVVEDHDTYDDEDQWDLRQDNLENSDEIT